MPINLLWHEGWDSIHEIMLENVDEKQLQVTICNCQNYVDYEAALW